MTDTTHEAPERIWFVKVGENIVPNSKRTSVEDVEYVRADLVQAAVAAALREAAKEATARGYLNYEDILSLITPDAQAALDRVVAHHIADIRKMVTAATASKPRP